MSVVEIIVCVFGIGACILTLSDQDRISPYSINMVSRRQELGIKKNVNLEILSWSNLKLSKLISQGLYYKE